MADVALAFLWHQHQPYYPDDVSGENSMPWVRLHGVKDYYGMALHLLDCPEMHCTINLVPSLLVQIQKYTEHGGTDQFLKIARISAESLTENDALFLLDHFFMASPERMIAPHPRYAELHHRRNAGSNSAREALRRFQPRDLRDLQVWFNLAWMHPLAIERDSELRDLCTKGRHFSEEDKNCLLDKHLEILRRIIPMHRQLAERGQVELTTTPFYHPILPLLLDKKLAREAMPDAKLPRYTGGYPEDAALHLRRALEFHAQMFGSAPHGLWPAEGSVCQAMLPLLADHGINWLATDEEILAASTHGFVSRDERGYVRNPERMYRPYRVAEGGRALSIVFRDHALSDMIGFQYQRSEGRLAAEDFVNHVRDIGKAVHGSEPAFVAVILDGENCWEHYPQGGVPFLNALYELCTKTPGVHPVRIGDYLAQHPPADTLPHLFAGSWIRHDFAIWIGHEEDNTAWDALHLAREHLRQRQKMEHIAPERVRQAWEELYIAEGSDWFWWFGDDHSCAQDAEFDYLFRKHLQNIYTLLGDTPPAGLTRPISRKGQRVVYTLPHAFLQVAVDGRRRFLDWIGAGRYTAHSERGTMAMGTRGPIKEVHFGCSPQALLIRVDFERPARAALAEFDALRVGFVEPAHFEVVIAQPGTATPRATLFHRGEPVKEDPGLLIGIDQIAELSIPLDRLGVAVGAPLHFCIEIMQNRQSRDRAPREGTINFARPSPDFERVMWNV